MISDHVQRSGYLSPSLVTFHLSLRLLTDSFAGQILSYLTHTHNPELRLWESDGWSVNSSHACLLVAGEFMIQLTLEDMRSTLGFTLTITFSLWVKVTNNMVCAHVIHSVWRKCLQNKSLETFSEISDKYINMFLFNTYIVWRLVHALYIFTHTRS